MNDEMDLASLEQAAAETLLPEEGGKGVADGHYTGRWEKKWEKKGRRQSLRKSIGGLELGTR